MSDTLRADEILAPDTGLTSGNGRYSFWYQGDGNFVLYAGEAGLAVWASATGGAPGAVVMQGDGNLVIVDTEGVPVWSAMHRQPYIPVPGSVLVMQNDGNAVVYTPDGIPVWATGTASSEPLEPGEPEPNPGGPNDATIFLLRDTRGPLVGALVQKDDGDSRLTDGSGFCHLPSSGEHTYTLSKEGYVTQEVRVGQGIFELSLAREAGAHPDPVAGRIRVEGGGFADDTGRRNFVVMHAGDMLPRWMAGGEAEVLADLDDIAEGGYHIVRTWWHLRTAPPDTPWAHGGSPPYNGCDSLHIPDFVEKGVAFANAVADRGMRVAIGSGGLDKVNTEEEHQMMDRFRAVIDAAGAWKFAWTEPVNEPSSTHGTSDDNGDVEPSYLRSLSDRMNNGTGILWHLGHASNEEWDTGRFGQKFFTPADAPVGYHHPYRDGHAWDKIRHRFSWTYEAPGKYKRLWILGEETGRPNSGPPLRYVSATANGHELTGEALALLGAVGALRGMGASMSGTGVQRYEPFPSIVGFAEIPWLIGKLPRDVNAFETLHHSGDSWSHVRLLSAVGECRVDGSLSADGRFAYLIYGPPGSYGLRVQRDFSGVLYNPADMTEEVVNLRAGDTLHVSFAVGRLLVSR